MSRIRPPTHCAVCGAAIPARALACPECGADERTGWREADPADGLDLPEEAFDHAAYVERENNGGTLPGVSLFWRVTGFALLAVVGALILRNLFWSAP